MLLKSITAIFALNFCRHCELVRVSMSCTEVEGTKEVKVVKPEKRIVGGETATPHKFPHHVLVFDKDGLGDICGGSLLSSEWVLTAAQCVEEPRLDSFEITAGIHNRAISGMTDPDAQVSKVKEIFLHQCFDLVEQEKDFRFYVDDIALIKLSSPFTLNEKVQMIEIDETDRAKPGTQATAVGWGQNSSDPRFADELKKATLKLANEIADCGERLAALLDVGSQICSNDMDGDVCFEYWGGSLLCKERDVNYVCGITTFPYSKSCEGKPSAFVRVFHYRNWIKEVMESGRNSSIDCTNPMHFTSTTTIPTRRKSRRPYTFPSASAVSTSKVQPGFYICMILISFLFTYKNKSLFIFY